MSVYYTGFSRSRAPRRDKLEWNTHYWRGLLKKAGFDVKEGDSPIVPEMLYDAELAQSFGRDLFDEGIYAVGFFFPVVPQGQADIRTLLFAAHEVAGLPDWQTDLQNPNFAKLPEAIGLMGVRIEDPADVRSGIKKALDHPGAALIDVLTDPNALSLPSHITADQVKGFGIGTMKLVLSGHTDEVLETA